MARSLEAASDVRIASLSMSDLQDMLDLADRDGEVLPFDPSYGETLGELLSRRLSEHTTRH